MNEDSPKATEYVAEWVATHLDEIGGMQLRLVQQEEHGRTYCAEFETPKLLIQLCAWDHADCLDILAVNKGSGETDYIVGGVCDGTSGLIQRLESFLHWLNVNEPHREV